MDELDTIREALAVPEPSLEVLQAARARLVDEADRRRRTPAAPRRRRRRTLGIAAVSVLIAGISAGVSIVATHQGARVATAHPRPYSPAADLLYRAAAAATTPIPTPASGQWIYTQETEVTGEAAAALTLFPTGERDLSETNGRLVESRVWLRADGRMVGEDDVEAATGRSFAGTDVGSTGYPMTVKGKGVVNAYPPSYQALTTMTTDPRALLRLLAGESGRFGRLSDGLFSQICMILTEYESPAAFQATAFEALALVGGMSLVGDPGTAEGRPVLAVQHVTAVDPGWGYQLLFDPGSYAFLGERIVSLRTTTVNVNGNTVPVTVGQTVFVMIQTGHGVVAHYGEVPKG
jgi:hypothetical protein